MGQSVERRRKRQRNLVCPLFLISNEPTIAFLFEEHIVPPMNNAPSLFLFFLLLPTARRRRRRQRGVYDPLNASNLLYVYPINGKLVAYSSSLAACAACARCAADVSCWSISSIGKYCVSMLLCSLGSNGARIRRRPSQATPLKKGCCLISLAPPMRPRRCSASHIRLFQMSVIQGSKLPRLGLRKQQGPK